MIRTALLMICSLWVVLAFFALAWNQSHPVETAQTKTRNVPRDILPHTKRFAYIGAMVGAAIWIGKLILDVAAVNPGLALALLVILACLPFIHKAPVVLVLIALLTFIYRNHIFEANLVLLGALLGGAVFGLLSGMIVGTTLGHFRGEALLSYEVSFSRDNPYTFGLILPAIGIIVFVAINLAVFMSSLNESVLFSCRHSSGVSKLFCAITASW